RPHPDPLRRFAGGAGAPARGTRALFSRTPTPAVSEPPPDALADFERVAVELTRLAGQIALAALRSPPPVEFKDEKRRDPVTETDRRIEDFPRAALRQPCPEPG